MLAAIGYSAAIQVSIWRGNRSRKPRKWLAVNAARTNGAISLRRKSESRENSPVVKATKPTLIKSTLAEYSTIESNLRNSHMFIPATPIADTDVRNGREGGVLVGDLRLFHREAATRAMPIRMVDPSYSTLKNRA